MVKIGLQLRANLDGVTNVRTSGEDFRWYLKLRCVNCGDVPDHCQYATLCESSALKGGRGEASLVVRCKLCSRDNSLDIVADSLQPLVASEHYTTVVVFDCRGLEPADFSPRIDWLCDGVDSGTAFSSVDLTDKEWVDYDERAAQSVGIYDLQWQFVKIK